MSIGSFIDDLEVLPAHEVPARYNSNVTDDAVEVSGSDPTLDSNDEAYDVATGSGPELGGTSSSATTYSSSSTPGDVGSVNDADTVNLTGMTESPMVASASGPNINGSGADAQQVSSRSYASAAAQAASTSIQKISSGLGASLAQSFLAPKSTTGKTVLQQTSQKGLGKFGGLLLFFFVGALVAMVAFD